MEDLNLEIYRYTVCVVRARDLMKADILGKSDPYVKVSIDKSSKNTKIIMRTLNPEWNERFIFNVDTPSEVTFEVYDWDAHSNSHDFLGKATVLFTELTSVLRSSGKFEQALKLDGVRSGEIDVEISLKTYSVDWLERAYQVAQKKNLEYMKEIEILKREVDALSLKLQQTMTAEGKAAKHSTPSEIEQPEPEITRVQPRGKEQFQVIQRMSPNMLREMYRFEVMVLSAVNVKGNNFNGFSDPYCIVQIGDQQQQTDTVSNSVDPVWKEGSFKFVCDDAPEKIEFILMDWSAFKNTRIGQAEVQKTSYLSNACGKLNLSLDIQPQGKLNVEIGYFKLVTRLI